MKIYAVYQSWGDYEDFREWRKYFLTKERAEQYATNCNKQTETTIEELEKCLERCLECQEEDLYLINNCFTGERKEPMYCERASDRQARLQDILETHKAKIEEIDVVE